MRWGDPADVERRSGRNGFSWFGGQFEVVVLRLGVRREVRVVVRFTDVDLEVDVRVFLLCQEYAVERGSQLRESGSFGRVFLPATQYDGIPGRSDNSSANSFNKHATSFFSTI